MPFPLQSNALQPREGEYSIPPISIPMGFGASLPVLGSIFAIFLVSFSMALLSALLINCSPADLGASLPPGGSDTGPPARGVRPD